jgi:hypothetical protein
VLTDGSGRLGKPRLRSTTRLLRQLHARPCPPYGRYTDADLYRLILNHRPAAFTSLGRELAETLLREGITHLVSDAAEGYNPNHDLCRMLADMAAEIALARSGRRITRYEFPLLSLPEQGAEGKDGATLCLELSEEEFARKLDAARAYLEMSREVEGAIARAGQDAFRVERLRPVTGWLEPGSMSEALPYYERHGEQQVAEGHYSRVLRYHQDMVPLMESLRLHATAPARAWHGRCSSPAAYP